MFIILRQYSDPDSDTKENKNTGTTHVDMVNHNNDNSIEKSSSHRVK